ncbi:aminoglycoside 3-N-acetyltransferase [Sphingomonas bacterium]|uniref:aminoglycoside 3-N-acetyltransferase n=1 Tax=Sphingomonas bacterium TaxID=1895847 RepID=UPI0020C6741B|nr:aminoglycoside 3-N-acetyltransferase [Sphingomonas bacterium]
MRADLRRLGVAAGDVLMIHAAMSRVGPLLNGPDALIGALLDVIGPEGTLIAYTSWDSVHDDLLDPNGRVLAEWRDHIPGFDPLRSRAVRMNGMLAEFLRTTPGARRSGNPGASIAALGRLADWITAEHPQDYGYGQGSPLAKLVETEGRVLMVGAPWDTMTLIHHADHLADVRGKRTLRYEVPYAGPDGVTWRMIEEFDTAKLILPGMPENYIERIVSDFVEVGDGRDGRVGQAASLLVDAAAILWFATSWIERWDSFTPKR